MNSSAFIFVPSSDDEYDWIIESYYQGYQKKNWKNPNNKSKSINKSKSLGVLDYSNELVDSNYAILMIRQWIELHDSQQNIKFSLLTDIDANIDGVKMISMDARSILKRVQKEGVLMDNDNGKYGLKIQKIRAELFRIKNYARIYSIDGLKNSLIDNGPALMILPVFNNPVGNNQFWLPNNNCKRLGGLDVVVCGYDKFGFKIIIPMTQKKIITFPYCDWGMQWETWAIINNKDWAHTQQENTTQNNKDFKDKDLSELEKSLVQVPIEKSKRTFFKFKKNKKIKVHPAPTPVPLKSEDKLQNLGLKIIENSDDSDIDI